MIASKEEKKEFKQLLKEHKERYPTFNVEKVVDNANEYGTLARFLKIARKNGIAEARDLMGW